MMRKLSVPLLLLLAVTSTRAAGPTIAIDAASPSGNVSRLFYGLMTEEISHSYDGGLYAELIRNRVFKDNATTPTHWSVVQGAGAAATVSLDRAEPLSSALPVSLRLEVTSSSPKSPAGISNDGYWGIP